MPIFISHVVQYTSGNISTTELRLIIENDVILQYLCIWQNEKSSANNETNEIYFRLTNEIYFLCVIMHNIRNHLSSIVNHRLMNRFGSERNYKSSSFSLGTNNCWHTCSQIADG